MKLVTGGAGFIGSHLVDALVKRGDAVRVVDDFSAGHRSFIEGHLEAKRVELSKGDILRPGVLRKALVGIDEVWHLAAEPDVRRGIQEPDALVRLGPLATFDVLEAMRKADCKRIVFTSTSTVYGEATKRPTPEDYGPLTPISMYGAGKLAAEGFVTAYAGTYGFQTWIFRFANVVGPRLTHGVIYDFHHALKKNPKRLRILGDGRQEKSYLSTEDCVDGMLHARDFTEEPVNLFNLGARDAVTVAKIAELVVAAHGLKDVKFDYTGGDRGWAGDVPRMSLAVDKMARIGWRPRHTSEQAVRRAAGWIAREG